MKNIVAIFLILLYPLSAAAFDYPVEPDASPQLSSAVQTDLQDQDNIQIQGIANRSYCCSLNVAPGRTKFPSTIDFATIVPSGGGSVDQQTDRTSSQPRVEARTCFYSEGGVLANIPVRLLLGGGGSFGGTQDTATECTDTTLYGGFNTSVSDFNFLELRSVLSSGESQIQGTLVIKDVVDDVTIESAFSVQSGGRTDVDIHSLVGSGAFGPITVIHDGPPGALVAVLYQYKIRTMSPLDFEAVALEKFSTRRQGLR